MSIHQGAELELKARAAEIADLVYHYYQAANRMCIAEDIYTDILCNKLEEAIKNGSTKKTSARK